jgi:hypothetical protein
VQFKFVEPDVYHYYDATMATWNSADARVAARKSVPRRSSKPKKPYEKARGANLYGWVISACRGFSTGDGRCFLFHMAFVRIAAGSGSQWKLNNGKRL